MQDFLVCQGVPQQATAWKTGRVARERTHSLPDQRECKVLLTSDYHMLRANGVFKRVGLEVLPRPYPEVEELKIDCQVGHPAKVRAAEPRKQKHDRRDADSLLKLLAEDRFPSIWMPSKELRDLRALLRHRHQWVRIRTRVHNALQAIALSHGLR
jgi:transposase